MCFCIYCVTNGIMLLVLATLALSQFCSVSFLYIHKFNGYSIWNIIKKRRVLWGFQAAGVYQQAYTCNQYFIEFDSVFNKKLTENLSLRPSHNIKNVMPNAIFPPSQPQSSEKRLEATSRGLSRRPKILQNPFKQPPKRCQEAHKTLPNIPKLSKAPQNEFKRMQKVGKSPPRGFQNTSKIPKDTSNIISSQ